MLGGFIFFSVLAAWTVVEFFTPKPSKTPEEKLGEALTEYLKSGVKIQQEDKK
ncbi:hypothetical protein K9N68_11085 [Kovacikia minuta CCNUW1]|uniref:hypothetical protein n=1 Tax=Kovacikia minuta TaxID=2931930 RepID=UPI001CCB8692|nr:hypothetical protein [Kovacikia minuta]UBF28368.1 hypothetical protein K9N68_11085 [Kovacikia minuta CCNUW1]